ncbi:unnamed protein product [Notodromas monacha]|uniref:General transcription factor IIH subunit n=1 Tax=Notodromas monacha TaxID=399045 RepID=A0A7R9GAV5_9CRUS|nr:unnamed protein product [Notodromas monacha]CAG0914436.1 unnamed protein product [Notodromas monacha]
MSEERVSLGQCHNTLVGFVACHLRLSEELYLYLKMAAKEEDPEDSAGYRWEGGYEKTWEAIVESADGLLDPCISDIIEREKRKRYLERNKDRVRLGMMRLLIIVIDMSDAMEDKDLKPSRQLCTLKLLEGFVHEYFDQNPISQFGIIITRNKRAEIVSPLSGNAQKHLEALEKLKKQYTSGEPSLQNSLDLATQALRLMPGHASREVLVIFGSLISCDPGSIIGKTIEDLKTHSIRCSVIGLAAEVRVCKLLCKETNGDYSVILDGAHFKSLLFSQVNPPMATAALESSLIKMGFPHAGKTRHEKRVSFCVCHPPVSNTAVRILDEGYFCPQCCSKYCQIPVECKICGLTLASAPHLARSYHHLFPLKPFSETSLAEALSVVNSEEDLMQSYCTGCMGHLKPSRPVFRCDDCAELFCSDCDLFLHEYVHTCPGCASRTDAGKDDQLRYR